MTDGSRLTVSLDEIDECFQGVVPSVICSLAADGKPNITNLSIVQRIDDTHVALSRQFFNKTVRNMAANPRLQVLVVEPSTGRQFRLALKHEGTQTMGPLFESMEARLDVVASQSGMQDMFKLRGIDVCEVLECEQVPSDHVLLPSAQAKTSSHTVEECSRRIQQATNIDTLLEISLEAFDELFGYHRSIFLAVDSTTEHLYVVTSRGFSASGAGAEIAFGAGVVGVAASRGRSVRAINSSRERLYSGAMKSSLNAAGDDEEIPLPRLDDVMSEMAVPILVRDRLLGVLSFQSATPGRFTSEDEDLASVVGRQIGLAMALFHLDVVEVSAAGAHPSPLNADRASIRHYAVDDSIFVDNEYVIKGVAGRLLWRLLQAYIERRRTEFTNRELRLDSTLDLPGYKDNLETRLILLRKRLEERSDLLSIASTGRGKFRLSVNREIELEEAV